MSGDSSIFFTLQILAYTFKTLLPNQLLHSCTGKMHSCTHALLHSGTAALMPCGL